MMSSRLLTMDARLSVPRTPDAGNRRLGVLLTVSTLTILAFCFAFLPGAARAGTLVVDKNGELAPGLASSWTVGEGEVVFVLTEGVDATGVAQIIEESISGATAKVRDGALVVSGLEATILLSQLSRLPLGDGSAADPLAALSDMGGAAVAFRAPEGGGSIRATNPNFAIAGMLPKHDENTRIVAEVVSVQRDEFPQVTLKLRIRRRARDASVNAMLKGRQVLVAPVLFQGEKGKVDFASETTRRNLAAYYLENGDRVSLHLLHDGKGKFRIDWITRQR